MRSWRGWTGALNGFGRGSETVPLILQELLSRERQRAGVFPKTFAPQCRQTGGQDRGGTAGVERVFAVVGQLQRLRPIPTPCLCGAQEGFRVRLVR